MSGLIPSSASNPCPICGRGTPGNDRKGGDCRIVPASNVILCHTNLIDPGNEANGFQFQKPSKCGTWGVFAPVKPKQIKLNRAKGKREFIYHSAPGTHVVKVKRTDNGKGDKDVFQSSFINQRWQNGLKDGVRQKIHLYRIFDDINQRAKEDGDRILLVEGESVTDFLLNLGIPATTSIGGAGKWGKYGHTNYLEDLAGANPVLCPDRDKPGIAHMNEIANELDECEWLCVYPDSPLWQKPLETNGLDLEDWITDFKRDGLSDERVKQNVWATVSKVPKCASVAHSANAGAARVSAKSAQCDPSKEEKNNLPERGLLSDRDLERYKALGRTARNQFDPGEVLPKELADMMINDAMIQNIDPVSLFQNLLPATASLMGRETYVDFCGFTSPNIIYSITVQSSGGGKSRARKIILAPLNKWQESENGEHKLRHTLWKGQVKEANKKNAPDDLDPGPEPTEKKYVFNIATPMGIVKRLAQQEDNGCILARDELRGMFKSFDGTGDSIEGMEVILEGWDGEQTCVDRVDTDNSYIIPSSRLSITGGVQPGIFQDIFKDPEDAQGVLARFLIACPRELPVVRYKGHCKLSDSLPLLYSWIKDQPWGRVTGTDEADDFFTFILESFGNEKANNAATKAWLNKLAGQTLRIALGLHAIECYYDRAKDQSKITLDTLQRAYKCALYYKACFMQLQGTLGNDGSLSGVLSRVYKTIQSDDSEDGLALSDIYRNVKAIRNLAKEESKPISECTLEICKELETLGHISITPTARSFKVKAIDQNEVVAEEEKNIDKGGGHSRHTRAETYTQQEKTAVTHKAQKGTEDTQVNKEVIPVNENNPKGISRGFGNENKGIVITDDF